MLRLDVMVTRNGLAESRERAQALILAGKVKVAGETERRPDRSVSNDARISVESGPDFASRGALKLGPAPASAAPQAPAECPTTTVPSRRMKGCSRRKLSAAAIECAVAWPARE